MGSGDGGGGGGTQTFRLPGERLGCSSGAAAFIRSAATPGVSCGAESRRTGASRNKMATKADFMLTTCGNLCGLQAYSTAAA